MTQSNKLGEIRSGTQLWDDRELVLGLAVNTLGRGILWSVGQRTSRYGVFPGVNPVVACLMQLPTLTQSELSRLVGIEQPTMAATLKRMERDGLISRSPDPAHGRRTLVKLTAKGRKLCRMMTEAARDVGRVATNSLTSEDVKHFFRIAAVMTENLNRERYGDKPRSKDAARYEQAL
jgi:MarR family transcriptional regulator, transcriptional regulator for hemolysin